nr:transcriptional regulator [Corynebacterium phoceense]
MRCACGVVRCLPAAQGGTVELSEARQALGTPIHSPVRLSVMAALNSVDSVDYQTLKDELGVSYSLLTKHATLLEEAGLLKISKDFEGRTPVTRLRLTRSGRRAFAQYLEALDRLVAGLT